MMTGWDIVSLVVITLLAGLFFRGWIAQQMPGAQRTSPPGSPQSLLESGGYRPQEQTRQVDEVSIRRGPATEERPPPSREQPRQTSRKQVQGSALSSQVRQRLSSPEYARMAFVMREVLDTPVGLRDEKST